MNDDKKIAKMTKEQVKERVDMAAYKDVITDDMKMISFDILFPKAKW